MLRVGAAKAQSERRVPLLNALSLLSLLSLFSFHVFNHRICLCSFRVSKNPTFWFSSQPFSSFPFSSFDNQFQPFGFPTSISSPTRLILRCDFATLILNFLLFCLSFLDWIFLILYCSLVRVVFDLRCQSLLWIEGFSVSDDSTIIDWFFYYESYLV